MSDSEKLFINILQRLNEAIQSHPVGPTEALETKQLSPVKFLELYFRRELILLHRFSETRIQDAQKLFLGETETMLGPLLETKEKVFPFAPVNKLCIYYAVTASCVNSRPMTEGEEVVDNDICKKLIVQSAQIFGNEFGAYTSFLQRHFAMLLAAAGSHSSRIYGDFFAKVQNDLLSAVSAKSLPTSLKPWIYMPASVYDVSKSLSNIASNTKVGEKYRPSFCDLICQTVMMSFRRDIKALDMYLSEGGAVSSLAETLHEQINGWNEKSNCFAWPAQLVLQLLMPAKEMNMMVFAAKEKEKAATFQAIFSKFKELKGNQKANALRAMLLMFRAVELSAGFPAFVQFAKGFYNVFLDYYKKKKKEWKDTETHNMACIDFPVAVLCMSPDDFGVHIAPMLLSETKPEMVVYMARIVRRVCRQMMQLEVERFSTQILCQLVNPTMTIVKRAHAKEPHACAAIPKLVTAFQHYPKFMRMMILNVRDFLSTFLSYCDADERVSPQSALIGIFGDKFVEETVINAQTLEMMKETVAFLVKTYCEKSIYQETHFSEAVPKIAVQVADFLVLLTQTNPPNVDQAKGLAPVLTELETAALLFLASHKKPTRLAGVSILSAMVEIMHTSDGFSEMYFPIDEYQTLCAECRRVANLSTAHSAIKNALRVIPIQTEGIKRAFDILYEYFVVLTKAVNPNMQLGSQPKKVITNHSYATLSEEWIGTVSVMLAICFNDFAALCSDLKQFLSDDGDIGSYIGVVAPTAVSVKHFSALLTRVTTWVYHLRDSDYLEVNDANTVFITNIIKLVRGLMEQKQWVASMINVDVVGDLLLTLCNYCNMVPGEDLRLMFSQFLISTMNLLNQHSVSLVPLTRHTIGKSVLGWLPTVGSSSKQYNTVVHQALALALDNLALIDCIDPNDPKTPEEQADSQFMLYFASIKNRLDAGESTGGDMVPVLAALLKQNLEIGIEHCISMGFDKVADVRAAFIAAVASVFRLPEVKMTDNEEVEVQETLTDLCMGKAPNWELVEFLCELVPYSRAEAFGASMLEASIMTHVEFEFLSHMITIEIARSDEGSKNTLFRGNSAPPRAVGHYPRVCGIPWMVDTLRPLMKEILDTTEKGMSYTVDPSRLEPGEDLAVNQERFRDIVNRFIDRICASKSKMPMGIILVGQVIWEKVKDRYGPQLADGILSGFLFLRFLLPCLSIPKLVNLPELLPDPARSTLTQISNVLNTSILRGRLDEKGKFLVPFNDIAADANRRFGLFFKEIRETVIPPEVSTEATIDAEKVLNSLHQELWPLTQQIESSIAEMDESSPTRIGAQKILNMLQQMGPPKKVRRARAMTVTEPGGTEGSLYDQLMATPFPEDQIEQLKEFIVLDDNNAPNEASILYVNCEKLELAKDPQLAPYMFFSALSKIKTEKAIVVLILHKFDESKLPQDLKPYATMPPMSKVQKYLCLQADFAFIQFAQGNATLFENPQRFSFVKEFADLASQIGAQCSKYLPPATLESLSRPESVHSAVVNGKKRHIRLHQHSVQIVASPEQVGSYSIPSVTVVLSTGIANLTQLKKCVSDETLMEFSFIDKISKVAYYIQLPNESPVYEGIKQLTSRTQTVMGLRSKVKIETVTLQWLMLNLAFVNMVSDIITPAVKKAALDLAYAAYVSFNFKHEMSITKAPLELIPDNFNGYVQSLAEDLAKCNPEEYAGFLTEYFKGFQYIKSAEKAATFVYLAPWIPYYAATGASHDSFTDNIIQAYSDLSGDCNAFAAKIWPGIVQYPETVRIYMSKIYKARKPVNIEIVLGFAALNKQLISTIWASELFPEAIKAGDKAGVAYIGKVIVALLSCHLFDMASITDVIYNLVNLRLYFSCDVVNGCLEALTNCLHAIAAISGKTVTYDIQKVAQAYSAQTSVEDFKNGTDKRTWLSEAVTVACAFKEVATNYPDESLKTQLFSKFVQDVDAQALELKSQSVIYASAMIGREYADSLAVRLLDWIKDTPDETTASTICLSLSLLDMDKTLASRLFYLGVVMALRFQLSAALDLIASALVQYSQYEKPTGTKINEAITEDVLTYIDTCTALDFTHRPIFSVLVIVARLCNSDVRDIIDKFRKCETEEPFVTVLGLLVSRDDLEVAKTLDFGNDWATVDACILLVLAQCRSDALIEYSIDHIAKNPYGCSALSPLNCAFVKGMLEKVDNIRYVSLVARSTLTKGSPYQACPLLLSCFFENEPVTLSQEQLDYLVSTILPSP